MAFELPPLPYPKNALEPHMSAQTFDFHHGKHHQAYVTNLNNLVKDTPMASQSLEEIILATAKDESKIGIFNNAAQVWNHTFFWNCMKPDGGGAPTGQARRRRSTQTFGGLDKFKEQFKAAAVGAVRQRLGLAGAPTAASSRSPGRRMRSIRCPGPDGAADLRCLGARLLSRLPEPPAGFRPDLPRQAGELGLRRRQPVEGRLRLNRPTRSSPHDWGEDLAQLISAAATRRSSASRIL